MVVIKPLVSGILAILIIIIVITTFGAEIKRGAAKLLGYKIEEDYYGLNKSEYFSAMQKLHEKPVNSVNALICAINSVTLGKYYEKCPQYDILDCGGIDNMPAIGLSNAKEQAIKEISESSISCWRKFSSGKSENTFCNKFDPSKLEGTITEDEVLNKLKDSGTYGGELYGGSLLNGKNIRWDIESQISSASGQFFICADNSGKNEIFVTRNKGMCPVTDAGKFDCVVKDFELPQEFEGKEISDPSTWVAGFGDPEYLLYYEAFPEGEDAVWQSSAFKISAIGIAVSTGLNVGFGLIGAGFGGKAAGEVAEAGLKGAGKEGAEQALKSGVVSVSDDIIKPVSREEAEKLLRLPASEVDEFFKKRAAIEAGEAGAGTLTREEAEAVLKLRAAVLEAALNDPAKRAALREAIKQGNLRRFLASIASIPSKIGKFAVTTVESAKNVLNVWQKIKSISVTNTLKKAGSRTAEVFTTAPGKAVDALGDAIGAAGIVTDQGVGKFVWSTSGTLLRGTVGKSETGTGLLRQKKVLGVLFAAVAAEYLDNKNEKFIPVGENQIGLRTPYTDTIVSGRNLMGLDEGVRSYYIQLERDEGWVSDQLPSRLLLASPCKADVNVRKGICECEHYAAASVYSFADEKVLQDTGGNPSLKRMEYVKSTAPQGESLGDYKMAVRTCNQYSWYNPWEKNSYKVNCIKVDPELEDDENYNFCYSGGHATASFIKNGVLAVGVAADIIVSAGMVAGSATGVGAPISIPVGLALLAASGFVTATVGELTDVYMVAWPNH